MVLFMVTVFFYSISASPAVSSKPSSLPALPTATNESEKEAATPPSTGNHDNESSGSPKPVKVLSSLVAYGDDSDSDIDT